MSTHDAEWPELHLSDWIATRDTLHMWTQIAGKIRLKLAPQENHWWHVPLYLTAKGLTTSPLPYNGRDFEICFDFIGHQLVIQTCDGAKKSRALRPQTVADFYHELMSTLRSMGIEVKIYTTPSEQTDPIPFEKDTVQASYDPEYANRFWRILLSTADVFKEFKGRFIGKTSPIHFFWGSFDLAMTRFSGRRAPEREGADIITKEAYSHEVISCGFWPGGGAINDAAFYCYSAPAPAGLDQAKIRPEAAFYSKDLGEFVLMYEDLRQSKSPKLFLLDFLQTTYETGADLAKWERESLERSRE
jgi:hypothetical protein